MTRGYFASQGINASVQTVRIRRKDDEVPNRTATLDLASLTSKYRGGTTREAANVIITNIRTLQKFFPRILLAPDGPIKPGKEDRTTSPPTKQQHLDGKFDLADQRYVSQQLAVRELLEQRATLKRADALPDLEVVASGGEGEDGAWLAYDAELTRQGVVQGHFSVSGDDGSTAAHFPVAAFRQVDIRCKEAPLTPEAARALAAKLDAEAEAREDDDDDLAKPKIVHGAASDGPTQLFSIMLDGEFLQGQADEVIQTWRSAERETALDLEVVDVPAAISASGQAVQTKVLDWYERKSDRLDYSARSAGQKPLPLFDAAFDTFKPAHMTSDKYVDVAVGVEALFGDFGCASPGYGTGQITLARLGVLAYGDYEKWRFLAAERAEWARDRTAWYRALLRHVVHPGGSDPDRLLSETTLNGNSPLEYRLWYSRRPHSLRTIQQVFKQLGLAPIDWDRDSEGQVQQALWTAFTNLGLVPSTGWHVSSSAFLATDSSSRETRSGLPPAPDELARASAAASAANSSLAGTGVPGTRRNFPLLGRNFETRHWDALGVSDAWRAEQGIFSPLPSLYAQRQTIREQEENELERRETEEAAAEVDEAWEAFLDEHATVDGAGFHLTPEQLEKLWGGGRAWEKRRQTARDAGWLQVATTLLDLARRFIPTVAGIDGLTCMSVDYRTTAFFDKNSNSISSFSPYVQPGEITKTLGTLSEEDLTSLFAGGGLSIPVLKRIWGALGTHRRSSGRENLEDVVRIVAPFSGLVVKGDKAERVDVLLEAGFASLLKPSILHFVLSIPRYRIAGRDNVERIYQYATFYGIRQLLDFARYARDEGLCDFDDLDLDSLATPLQRWFGTEGRWTRKPHVLTALHSLGYAKMADLRLALVPSRNLVKAAQQFYGALQDRVWIGYRQLADKVSWGQRGSLKELVEWTTRLAATGYLANGTDPDSLGASEIELLLGGRPEFVVDPRPIFHLSSNRAWWRALNGPEGNLLEEELQQEANEAAKKRRELLARILDTLRTKPHRSFIGTDEMDDWATHLDYGMVRQMRAEGTRTVLNLYEQIVRPALLEGISIDTEDETAVEEYLGGKHVMAKNTKGVLALQWLSADPEEHPEVKGALVRKRKEAPEVYAPGTRRSARKADLQPEHEFQPNLPGDRKKRTRRERV